MDISQALQPRVIASSEKLKKLLRNFKKIKQAAFWKCPNYGSVVYPVTPESLSKAHSKSLSAAKGAAPNSDMLKK